MLRTFTREKQAEFERGRQEGIEEGLEQGIEQGIEQGVLKVARNMLAAGIAPATIAEFTGLALDAVLALQANAQSSNGQHHEIF